MKFILPCLQIKLHKKTQNTAQNCTTKCPMKYTACCIITFIEKLIFLCIFDFVKLTKNKIYILNEVFKLLLTDVIMLSLLLPLNFFHTFF